MASIIKPLANEQTFITPNTFLVSGANYRNLIRIVNTGNTSASVLITNTVSSSQYANLTLLPYTEVVLEKSSNNTITASSTNLLGVAITFSD